MFYYKNLSKKIKELNQKDQPVLIGTISIEKNELLSVYLKQEGISHTILNAKNHEKEGEIIAQAGRRGTVTIATNMAGRGIDIKLGGNPLVKKEYEFVKSVGGLFVLGTERHEARRIDNQLRGRSGRQGDPGGTQFYVSLEDDLMRVFGSERIKTMMGHFNIPEEQPIENRFISRSLENAQAKIEGFYFDARKNTLEYDDVMNHQRKIIYTRRQKMMHSNKEEIEALLEQILENKEEKEKLEKVTEKKGPTHDTFSVAKNGEKLNSSPQEVRKIINEKRTKLGDEAFLETVRRIALYTTDVLWMEHLEAMDYLRSSVNLRAYGQREPIVEYKREGLQMFREMEEEFKEKVFSLIKTINTDIHPEVEVSGPKQTLITSHNELKEFSNQKKLIGNKINTNLAQKIQKVGRNEPCPCGSGKKYKKCHGA